jgi:hypothetical protein
MLLVDELVYFFREFFIHYISHCLHSIDPISWFELPFRGSLDHALPFAHAPP